VVEKDVKSNAGNEEKWLRILASPPLTPHTDVTKSESFDDTVILYIYIKAVETIRL